MRCPFCRSLENNVVDSRTTEDGGAIRRRRACHKCQKRFTSYERVEEALPMVVKKDGRREPFDRKKLGGGLTRACEKRPVGTLAIDRVLDRLERRLLEDGEREVTAETLGGWVMEELRELDEVAYVRFASVYRSFADVTDFTAEVDRLRRAAAHASVPPAPAEPKREEAEA